MNKTAFRPQPGATCAGLPPKRMGRIALRCDVEERVAKGRDELVAELYVAAAGVAPWSRPLELLAELTQSDKVFLMHHDFSVGRGEITASFNVEPNFVDSYREIYSRQNPWLARASYFQAEGLVWRGSEIVDPGQLKETDFFKLFLYGQAIGRTAHIVVHVNGSELAHAMLTRRPPGEEYDDATLEICRLFARHVKRALNVTDAMANRRLVEESLNKAMDDVAAGVAIVEPPAKIIKMNSVFESLLRPARSQGDFSQSPRSAAPFSNGGRPVVEAKLPRTLVETLALNPVPRFCILEDRDEGARPIAVEIRRNHVRCGPHGSTRTAFVLFCRQFDNAIQLDEGAIRAAYGLTPAEARVCSALVRGENILALSGSLGISAQTARTHLKRIYDKTSTVRQPELMRLLLSFAYRKTLDGDAALKTAEFAGSRIVPAVSNRGQL